MNNNNNNNNNALPSSSPSPSSLAHFETTAGDRNYRTRTYGSAASRGQRRRQCPSPFQTSPASHPLHHQPSYYQRPQFRRFVFDSRRARKTKKKKNPFKVLKVPKESLYKDVKRKFLKIAMNNHPDTHKEGLSEKEQEAMRDMFIEARVAFEMLAEDPEDGTAILVEEKEDRESNFDSWFHNETGLKNPFDVDIDPETMKEVAEMTEKLGGSQGMDRDGGMWALARMVTSAVKSGGDAASILRLESGDVKERPGQSPDGKLRRRRKR